MKFIYGFLCGAFVASFVSQSEKQNLERKLALSQLEAANARLKAANHEHTNYINGLLLEKAKEAMWRMRRKVTFTNNAWVEVKE